MLRYVDATAATVWVETDGACEVDVLGHRARTFQVEGHHYAVVPVTGLQPGSSVDAQGVDPAAAGAHAALCGGLERGDLLGCMLGGDVHQAYLEAVGFRPSAGVSSAVYQAVCSPFRNQLGWLLIDGRRPWVTIETTPGAAKPELEVTLQHQLA